MNQEKQDINLDELNLSELFNMSLVTKIMVEQENILNNFINGGIEDE